MPFCAPGLASRRARHVSALISSHSFKPKLLLVHVLLPPTLPPSPLLLLSMISVSGRCASALRDFKTLTPGKKACLGKSSDGAYINARVVFVLSDGPESFDDDHHTHPADSDDALCQRVEVRGCRQLPALRITHRATL